MPRAAKVVALPAPAPAPAPAPEIAAPEVPDPEVAAPGAPVSPEGAAVLVPLADLYLSPLNPRQDHDAEGIDALAESLRTLGLLQNLAGLRDPEGRVGIVAGGRRLAALTLAAETNPELAIAQFEREPIAERTREGLEAARKRGRVGGRPPSLSPAQKDEVRRMRDEETRSVASIAQLFKVSGKTVRRA